MPDSRFVYRRLVSGARFKPIEIKTNSITELRAQETKSFLIRCAKNGNGNTLNMPVTEKNSNV